MVGATHSEELPFEALIRLLEQGEENSPCHTIETHPEIIPRTFSLKNMEEDIHRGRMPKVVAQNWEGPYEGPALGMQLGGGHVDFCQQCPLEASEGETQLSLFEDSLA